MTSIGISSSERSETRGTRHYFVNLESQKSSLYSVAVRYQLLIMPSISLDTLKAFKLDRVLSESEQFVV